MLEALGTASAELYAGQMQGAEGGLSQAVCLYGGRLLGACLLGDQCQQSDMAT
jgi:hypothetical protein